MAEEKTRPQHEISSHNREKCCWTRKRTEETMDGSGFLLTLAHSNIDLSPQSRTNFSAVDSRLSVSVLSEAVAIVIIENKTQIFFILEEFVINYFTRCGCVCVCSQNEQISQPDPQRHTGLLHKLERKT